MLSTLHIDNIAVVKRLDIEFLQGMTVLTGETGAGKSIIIDSLNLISGARGDKELIRNGENKAEVSAIFSDIGEETQEKINELGFECEDGTVFISRSLGLNSSTARVNGVPTTLGMLKKLPALLFGMYNVGYQNYAAAGTLASASFFEIFAYGFLAVLPKILVSYIVGLGIEFVVAQWKNEEIQEGFLVSGIIIPMIIPVNTPLWMLALAVAFSVILAKEIYGGTGMNIFNPALITRAFLFFSYPAVMTGDDNVWVSQSTIFGLGNNLPDTYAAATPLGNLAQGFDSCAAFVGLIPGAIGETSVIAIALGALILLWTGVASWKIMLSVFVGICSDKYAFSLHSG